MFVIIGSVLLGHISQIPHRLLSFEEAQLEKYVRTHAQYKYDITCLVLACCEVDKLIDHLLSQLV